jgi:hypothetical protein
VAKDVALPDPAETIVAFFAFDFDLVVRSGDSTHGIFAQFAKTFPYVNSKK